VQYWKQNSVYCTCNLHCCPWCRITITALLSNTVCFYTVQTVMLLNNDTPNDLLCFHCKNVTRTRDICTLYVLHLTCCR